MPPDTGARRARPSDVLMKVFSFAQLPLYGAPDMSSRNIQFGLAIVLCCTVVGQANAQQAPEPPVKPTGPAAKKADDLIRTYTARIENEIVQAQKELDRLRGELHELIDVRDDMAKAIADVRADLAAKGTYGADPAVAVAQPPYGNPGPALGFSLVTRFSHRRRFGPIAILSTAWVQPYRKTQVRKSASSSGGWHLG